MTQFDNGRETSRRTDGDDRNDLDSRTDRNDRTDLDNRTDLDDRTSRDDRTDRSDRTDRTDLDDRTSREDRGERTDRSDRRSRDDLRETTTSTDADMSARMAGTHRGDDRDDVGRSRGDDVGRSRADGDRVRSPKTSAAAVFSLVFGLAALFCALTVILSPAAVVFGLIGIVLGMAGLGRSKRRGVTGRGVAIGGLVTAVLGLILGATVIAGAGFVVNDEARLDQLQNWIEDRRADLPSTAELREEFPS